MSSENCEDNIQLTWLFFSESQWRHISIWFWNFISKDLSFTASAWGVEGARGRLPRAALTVNRRRPARWSSRSPRGTCSPSPRSESAGNPATKNGAFLFYRLFLHNLVNFARLPIYPSLMDWWITTLLDKIFYCTEETSIALVSPGKSFMTWKYIYY